MPIINAPYLLSTQHISVSFFGLDINVNSNESCQAFAMFDDDNSGTISLEEMMMLISKIGGNLTEGEAVGLIRQIRYCVRENRGLFSLQASGHRQQRSH